jgi:hypothetical protein
MYESGYSTTFRALFAKGNELVVRATVNSAAKSAFGDEREADRILPNACRSWNDDSYGI